MAERFGYGLVHGPMFEDLGVFQRLGDGTDVVRKEMYDFHDKGDRHMALRPEATASVARAYVQHRPPTPWKVWCVTPAFRYERPQAGRLRQHHQVDVEVIGAADPDVDVEVIALGAAYLDALGLRRWRLVVNTMGTPADRVAYAADAAPPGCASRAGDLAPDDREKVETPPAAGARLQAARAPRRSWPTRPAWPRCSTTRRVAHFERVQAGLRRSASRSRSTRAWSGASTTTRTPCSSSRARRSTPRSRRSSAAAATTAWSSSSAGRPRPASASARASSGCCWRATPRACSPAPASSARRVRGRRHRRRGRPRPHRTSCAPPACATDRAFDGRSMKAQMKAAGRSGARVAVIVGEQEAADGTRHRARPGAAASRRSCRRDQVVDVVRKLLEAIATGATTGHVSEHASRTPVPGVGDCARTGAASCGPTTSGSRVALCGWVARRREHGEHLAFVDLRDREGVVQCVVDGSVDVRSEWVVRITGRGARPARGHRQPRAWPPARSRSATARSRS